MNATDVTHAQLVEFVYAEARLLDAKRFDDWNALFTDDAFYWVPATPDQPDGDNWVSHMYEDKLLRVTRIERLKSPRAFSQQPPSRCHHLLQAPHVETFEPGNNHFVTRTEFHYTESQGDSTQLHVGTARHHLSVQGGNLRMTLKRVNMMDCDAALPAIQLFI